MGSKLLAMVGLAAVGAALITPAGGAGAASTAAPQVFPSVQVTTDDGPGRAYNQPQMLIDPKDPNILVIAGGNYNGGNCGVWVSRDRGATWAASKASARPPQYTTCVRSDLGPFLGATFAGDGSLVVVSAADNLGGQQDVNDLYAAHSTDLGDTWDFTIIHKGDPNHSFTTDDGSAKVGGEHYSLVTAAADPTDPRYVYGAARVGQADRTPPYGLFGKIPLRSVVATSSDGGKTWGPPVDIMADVPQSQIFGAFIPEVTVGRDGAVYAITREKAPPADPAKPFGPSSPPGGPGAGGRKFVSVSTDHGKTWKTTMADDSAVHCGGCDWPPAGKADPNNGNLYMVFGQSGATSGTPTNVFFKSSTDGGKTWSDLLQLNDDKDATVDHWYPGISVAPNGRIDVAWIDFRSSLAFNATTTLKTENYWDLYYTYSTDGGKTWAKNMRISDRSMAKNEGYTVNDNYGLMGPAGVASTDEAAYFSWSDSRRGTVQAPVEDYYFTTARFVAPKTASTSRGASFAAGVATGILVAGVVLLLGVLAVRSRRPAAGTGEVG
ncbi:MAG TPA: sialidase family protein [Acidimicrobiales bacterium]|nr:sialidase family protein [Acidimicrobiales bacterium]